MRTILLSFESTWFEHVEAGKAKFEYRMVLPKEDTLVYFYVSKPVMAITGIAHFGPREPLSDWLITYGNRSPEVQARIQEYMQDCKYATRIYEFQPTIKIPLSLLRKDVPGFAPPRMYYYIDGTELLSYLKTELHPTGPKFSFSFDNILDNEICT